MPTADSTAISPFQWLPPRWLQLPFNGLQAALGWGGAIASMVSCIVFVHYWSPQWSFVGMVLTPLLGLPTIAIHEWGHVLGARAAGMTVSHVFVGPFQFQAQRHGWRMRWHRSRRKTTVHGFVRAYPNPDGPMRNGWLLMTGAGPAANLLTAAAATAIALALGHSAFGWLAAGMAMLNLAVGLANLLPTSREAASDGLLLLQWLRCKDENTPELHFSRLGALSITGVLDEDLPQHQVEALARMPMPMPLAHAWIVLKQHQHAGAWDEGADLADLVEERIATVPDEYKPYYDSFIRSLRCEIRFTRSMAGRMDEGAIGQELNAECDWHHPWLRPRCHALVAALANDESATRRHLADARRWAERSIDRSLEMSEAILGEAILARLGCAGTSRQDSKAV